MSINVQREVGDDNLAPLVLYLSLRRSGVAKRQGTWLSERNARVDQRLSMYGPKPTKDNSEKFFLFNIGASPSGKAHGFGPCIRGFESLRPSHED